jgi:hypothetical protein
MNPTIDTMLSKLSENLSSARSIDSPLERLTEVLKSTDETMSALKEFALSHAFKDEQEQIEFFKHIKPAILSNRIEETLCYNLTVNKPIGTPEIQLDYFEEELRALQSFFRMNSFHYQYYKNHFSELDNSFFLPGSPPLKVPIADIITDSDAEFSTPMSYLFSKFIAYENTQYFIIEQIAALQEPGLKKVSVPGDRAEELKWTGDSINIVELAYGLWLTGQLNNGNASLNQIVRWLETNFQVNIGIVQRRFAEIQKRKRLSPTKYIDLMRDNILQKIENENA